MDSKHIEHLLEKYWECETSLQEEAELKAFFNQEEIPEHLQQHAPLFKYLKEESGKPELGESFDQEVLSSINSPKAGKEVVIRSWYAPYMKVAAVVLVLIVASFAVTTYLNKQEEQAQMADTFQSPEDAFEETKKALLMISKNISKGRSHAQKITVLNEAEQKIKNNEL